MKTTLFELAEEYRNIFQSLMDGNITEKEKEFKTFVKDKLDEKLEAYTVMISQFTSNIENRKKTIEELEKKNDRDKNSLTFLQDTLKSVIKMFGVKTFTDKNLETFELIVPSGIRILSSPSVSVEVQNDFENELYGTYNISFKNLKKEDLDKLKAALQKPVAIKQEFNADKALLKTELENKKVIEGASLKISHGLKIGVK